MRSSGAFALRAYGKGASRDRFAFITPGISRERPGEAVDSKGLNLKLQLFQKA